MTYRAKPITQRDGSSEQFSNCRLAAGATGIDYHTLGATLSDGAKMRKRSGDPSGGTTSDDIARAWKTYGETISIRDGKTWADAEEDLKDGRLVHIDVWHQTAGGPCLSGSGRYGHTMAIAPERHTDGKRWLVSDPWCNPPKWSWWSATKLQAGAEEWYRRVRENTRGRMTLLEAAKELLRRWDPGHPAPADEEPEPAETSGPALIMYTASMAHGSDDDMAIQAPESLRSDYRAKVPKGTPFYSDGAMSDRLGEISDDHLNDTDTPGTVGYAGRVVDRPSRAIIITTRSAYEEGSDSKPTIVYVNEGKVTLIDGPTTGGDVTARDKEWRTWLNSDTGAPDK